MHKNRYIKFSNQLFLLILGVLLIFSHTQCKLFNDEPEEPEIDFAVKDTANIVKFRISDTENNSIAITRDNNDKIWMIEGTEYRVQPDNVKLIMETFYRIRVKQDVPEKGVDNLLTHLSVRHKKVEIFLKLKDQKKTNWWYICIGIFFILSFLVYKIIKHKKELIMNTPILNKIKIVVLNLSCLIVFTIGLGLVFLGFKWDDTTNNSDPIKTWFIGGATQDHLGTYMLLQNGTKRSSIPYIVHRPDENSSLDVRFFTSSSLWRASDVYNYHDPMNIKSVKIEFGDNPKQSFTAIRNNEQSVSLHNYLNQKFTDFDSIQLKHYFTHYYGVFFNKVMEKSENYADSVYSNVPTYSIELKDIHGKTTLSEIWKIKYHSYKTDSYGNTIEWDPEYGYLRLNKQKKLLRIQYQNWELLFKPISFFIR